MILQVLIANLMDGRNEVIHLCDRSDYGCPIWEINSKLEYECNNKSNGKMITLPLFKIRTNHDQVPLDKDRELL